VDRSQGRWPVARSGSGRHPSTRASSADSVLAPLVENMVLADQGTRIGDGAWIRYGAELRDALVSQHVFVGFRARLTHAALDAQFEGGSGVHIGSSVIAMGRDRAHGGITDDGGIRIGTGAVIGAECILEGSGGIRIGSSTRMEAAVYVLSSGHNIGKRSLPWLATPVTIGAGATLVGPLNIGAGARIAPGAVVIKDVYDNEAYS